MATKRIDIEGGSLDRISSLPDNIIDHILACIPARDAARTSILSRSWRYIWAGHPHLELDKQFCKDIRGSRSSIQFQQYHVNVVNKILFQHVGPVLKFVLQLPSLPPEEYSIVDQWLLFLSRQGLLHLNLDNPNPTLYNIPSCIFSCPGLTSLTVSKCIFKTPTALEGFKTLKDLRLYEITFESPVQVFMPNLANLCMLECRGVRHFNVSGLALKILTLSGVVEHHRQNERILSTKILSSWPSLKYLLLNGDYLKYIITGSTIPERLPTPTLECLTGLAMFHFAYSFDEIGCILCLLRRATNLRKLTIEVNKIASTDMKVADYLEKPGVMNQSLEGLQTVMLTHFQGSKNELLFVKFLLANSPSIERMFLEEDEKLDPIERLRISKELMQFSRASTKAKIIFQPALREIFRAIFWSG